MLRALIVDDHPTTAMMLGELVQAEGYTCEVFECPRRALACATERMPDICFLDWNMPEIGGLEVLRCIRALPGGDRCYVIMQTARNGSGDVLKAFKAGVDDFIAKPVQSYELSARLTAAARLCTMHQSLAQRLEEVSRLNDSLQHANQELERMSTTDSLTGLLNRRAGELRLHEAWMGAIRYHAPLSVGVVDIDYFKKVNDTYGHGAGDSVIRHVATLLRNSARATDAVSRFGGEEFVIVLPNTNASDATALLERIRQEIASQPLLEGESWINVTISGGVAGWCIEEAEAAAMLKAADRALYDAKEAGRNRIRLARAA